MVSTILGGFVEVVHPTFGRLDHETDVSKTVSTGIP